MIVRLLVASFALASVVSQQRTLVVDQAAGPYTEISAAIAAARPGDRIEVRPGVYSSFTVSIGLEIVAPLGGAIVFPAASISILNVPAQQAVRLDGLELDGTVYFGNVTPATFLISGCAGVVHLHRFTTSVCRSSVENSARVSITRSSFGGVPSDPCAFTPAGAGLLLVNASTVLDSCGVYGGGGHDAYAFVTLAGSGAVGLSLQQSQAFVTDCALLGGRGGNGYPSMSYIVAGNGGNGVNGDVTSSLCTVGSGSILGGPGGYGGTYGPGFPGVGITPGSAMSVRLGPAVSFTPVGAPVTLIAEPPHVIAPLLLPSGTIVAIQTTNTANQAVLLGIDLWNDLIPLPGVELPFVLTTAASLYAFAPPSPASSITFTLAVPSAPWLLQQFVHMQAVAIDGSGALQCSSGGYGRIN